MLDMETTVGELNCSLPQPSKSTRRKRAIPAGPKPISPLTIQQAPCVRRSRSPTLAMQLSTPIIHVLHNKQAANRDDAAATAATVVSVAVAVVVTIAAMHHRHGPHNSVNHRWT